MRDTWWRVGGWAIHGWEGGDGPAVVLVHGLGVSGRYLLPLARALAADRRVVVPDLPGFGRSTRPPRPLRLDELTAVLDHVTEAAAIERPVFVANSFGCQVVTRFAAVHPDRVERLVLVGPTVDDSARDPLRQTTRLLVDALREPPRLVAIVVADYLSAGPATVARTALEALRHPIEADARRVSAPAAVIRGSRDRLVPQEWAARLTAAFPAGTLHVVEREPHAAHFTNPDAVAAIIREESRPARG